MARGRKKTKDGVSKLIYLDREEVKMIEMLAANEGLSFSAWVGRTGRSIYLSKSTGGAMKLLKERLTLLRNQKAKLEEEETQLAEQLERAASMMELQEHNKALNDELETRRQGAVKMLRMHVQMRKLPSELQRYAREQSLQLENRWSPEELLAEAYQ